jgi:hypothetical protein
MAFEKLAILANICYIFRYIQLSELTYDEASYVNNDECMGHLTGLTIWLHLKGIFDMVKPHFHPGRYCPNTLMRDTGYRFVIYESIP